MVSEPIRRLALVGTGLIGGSLARALKACGAVQEVVGCARTAETLQLAQQLGVVDRGELDPGRAVTGADVVVLALPVRATESVLQAIAPAVTDSAVLTDVGSVKGEVVAVARQTLGQRFPRFVPGHPIAGAEQSGVAASVAELFQDKHVILTPIADTDPQAVEVIKQMWRHTGADVLSMDVSRHDALLGVTSHLPHILAYALVDYLASHPEADTLFELAAAGFYDFTRIASSDPIMWRDISVTNRSEIVKAIKGYQQTLDELLVAVEGADAAQLESRFERAKQARDRALGDKEQKQ